MPYSMLPCHLTLLDKGRHHPIRGCELPEHHHPVGLSTVHHGTQPVAKQGHKDAHEESGVNLHVSKEHLDSGIQHKLPHLWELSTHTTHLS